MQKTNWLFLVFVVVLGVWIGLFVKGKTDNLLVSIPLSQSIKNTGIQNNELQKIRIGDLEMEYPEQVTFKNYDNVMYDFDTHIKKTIIDTLVNKNISDYSPIKIYFKKDANLEKLPIKDWLEINDKYVDTKSPVPTEQREINISGINMYEDVYEAYSHGYEPYAYDVLDIYFARGTDIYEVWGYKLPDSPDPALTPTDIQSAREYEQIFNQILSSFKFVE